MALGNYIDRSVASVLTVALCHLDHKLDNSLYNFDTMKARWMRASLKPLDGRGSDSRGHFLKVGQLAGLPGIGNMVDAI